MTSLQETFKKKEKFFIGVEVVTTPGMVFEADSRKITSLLKDHCENERLDWISVTDNAGGNPNLAPSHLGRLALEYGKPPVIHLTCKDRNRNALLSTVWAFASEGMNNVLVLSGDYPVTGYEGVALPVFDIDSVGLISLLNQMNRGLAISGRRKGSYKWLSQADLFIGCAVSPFKSSEAELVMQYEKLKMKYSAGAGFLVPQLGYDMRKSHELLCFMEENHIDMPVLGNVYILNKGVAAVFNKGFIPGCVVSDLLLERIQKESTSPDKGRKYCIELAAKQVAVFKGMGYHGAYLGGVESPDTVEEVMSLADRFNGAEWRDLAKDVIYPKTNEFYYYQKDVHTNLADRASSNPEMKNKKGKYLTLIYRVSLMIHALVFHYQAPFFKLGQWIYKILEKLSWLNTISYFNERAWKASLFECRECGDCSLPEIAYLCPESQCAKNQRNGPCGGSNDGMCEVESTGKVCIWVRAYYRRKRYGKGQDLLNRPVVIKHNALKGTSSWANFFLMRDHGTCLEEKSIRKE